MTQSQRTNHCPLGLTLRHNEGIKFSLSLYNTLITIKSQHMNFGGHIQTITMGFRYMEQHQDWTDGTVTPQCGYSPTNRCARLTVEAKLEKRSITSAHVFLPHPCPLLQLTPFYEKHSLRIDLWLETLVL